MALRNISHEEPAAAAAHTHTNTTRTLMQTLIHLSACFSSGE